MLSPTDYNHLREFVDLIEQMQNLALSTRVLAAKQITLRIVGGDSEILNFNEEECRSFILGCRLLIQNNDQISILCIWGIFRDKIKDAEWFCRINPPRMRLNLFLDQTCPFAAPGGASTTFREIMDTFLYGSYAHRGMNRVHRDRFLNWQSEPQQFLYIKQQFILILKVLLETAVKMSQVVLEWMRDNAKHSIEP